MKKSNKQRRAEIKARRLERAAAASAAHLREKDVRLPQPDFGSALGCEPADRFVLEQYNNTYGVLPAFYAARPFTCRDCGAEEVWTAKQQKWWYEVVHGHIDSRAVRCLACRRARRERLRNAPPGASLLREQTDRLRALGDAKPTASAVAEIEAALECKWWSLRVVAIQTMARWGGEANLAKLHELMAARPEGGRRYFAWERVAADAARSALLNRERWP
ncbi:zinc-ribbon domain containing protein [Variovorax sp. 350MFTsu5.1]|uniref:zinc-ribbon domain containing protein n=1 Tax=Variovorax sp. 350MFTsu5.1 TaxID=3158365 RepID=UPI003AAABF18